MDYPSTLASNNITLPESANDLSIIHHMFRSTLHTLTTYFAVIDFAAQPLKAALPHLIEGYEAAIANKLITSKIDNRRLQAVGESIKDIAKAKTEAVELINTVRVYETHFLAYPQNAEVLTIKTCVDKLLKNYVFTDKAARALVHNELKQDFTFKGVALFIDDLLDALLTNSLQAINKVNRGEITIWSTTDGHWNFLHFKDTGAGVEASRLPMIFERMFSTRGSQTKAALGLCRGALRKFGGDLTFTSVPNEVTEFVIKFPIIK
jgi:signal transduction histidine kinase